MKSTFNTGHLFPCSLDEQIVCVEREIRMRRRVYPGFVSRGRMSREKADNEIRAMEAVLSTLKTPSHRHETNVSHKPPESGRSELTQLLAGGWLPMAEAPKDGTSIQAHIHDHGSDNVLFWIGGLDADNNDCGGWAFAENQEPPDCWTDGACWDSNDDGEKSIEPMCWKPLPS